jgi:hypothetical protein
MTHLSLIILFRPLCSGHSGLIDPGKVPARKNAKDMHKTKSNHLRVTGYEHHI